ncbi:hypothetical protein ACRAWF_19155 [Streptomyces sp. L7]
MGALHSSRADSRTGSQFPHSSATTSRELPGEVNVVGHPDLRPAPTLTSLWCSVTTNSSVGTAMLDAGFVEVGRIPRNTLAMDGILHDEVYMVREFGTADE